MYWEDTAWVLVLILLCTLCTFGATKRQALENAKLDTSCKSIGGRKLLRLQKLGAFTPSRANSFCKTMSYGYLVSV